MDFTRENLEKFGFSGFIPITKLKAGQTDILPKHKGLYIVYKTENNPVEFLKRNLGGHFKGRTPTVDISELKSKWVENCKVIYIGQAGGTSTRSKTPSSATLQKRIKQYIRFGLGKPVGHWGGRYIWQIKDIDKYEIAYKILISDNPIDIEKELLKKFKEKFGKLPFANLK